MNSTRGKLPGAKKVVIYGVEGIGKSTFAAQFQDPVFIDTEDSTKDMNVARFDKPTSWEMLLSEVRYVIAHPECCGTLVIDTADWAEQLELDALMAKNHWDSIETPGYGKGYQYSAEEFGRLLNLLSDVAAKGCNVVMTAHAWLRKIEQPDEMGAYDHWEMKTSKKVAPLIREWADMVLFANYKTIVVNVDGQGSAKGKNKAQGGRRVMYTSHHPCWDAKNRYGLPDELPLDYAEIAHIIGGNAAPAPQPEKQEPLPQGMNKPEPPKEPVKKPAPEPAKEEPNANPYQETIAFKVDERIPKALADLMKEHLVQKQEIQTVVGARGYFPADMPIWEYPSDFIEGVLVGAWGQVYNMIMEAREKQEIPFTFN
ncbi:MAG: AAA family ATPase [Lachnospiraceae bacterium]|nr:AAA family ATPase [Lachnospiraceae bacterium]